MAHRRTRTKGADKHRLKRVSPIFIDLDITNEKLKELLVEPGHINMADFELAARESGKTKIPTERILVEKGFISDENLGKTIADAFDYHFVDLKKQKITDDLLALIPEVVARSQQAVIFEWKTIKHKNTENTKTPSSAEAAAGNQEQRVLKIAISNPENYEFIKLLERKTGCRIEIYYATPLGIEEALRYYKSNLGVQVKKLIEDLKTREQENTKTKKQKNTEARGEENIVKLVNLFLEYAHDNRASDIHIEPLENSVSVRFRIDGVLHEAVQYPKELHEKIVFRIKIMAKLRTDEHAAAQDGRFDYKIGGARFDVRVSMMPITNGENVVMRLLAESSRRLSLEDLGLLGTDLEKVKRAAAKPYGMLLAAGPTGSGKTTTLYAILQILNKPEVNIMTIEDPVEYDVEHVQQTQVNAKKNLTFATGLRSIVRQDPDIIMVGEIRDNETAAIAVNAAMTGHLLLSTLHANDAATAFPRLMDMGVEPFLVSSSVNVVVAQRLVRKICEKCRMSIEIRNPKSEILNKSKIPNSKIQNNETDEIILSSLPPEIIKEIFGNKKIFVYKGAGCKTCGNTGYSGRIGIFEVMEIAEELRPLITSKASSDIIDKKAKELGMASMLFDGLTKAARGITTLEEVIRATKT